MIVTLIIVAAAVAYAAWRVYRLVSGRQSPCGGCDGCSLCDERKLHEKH